MTRYALNLPVDLKHEAEILAKRQGVSLNQFIMWAVSEKVTSMRNELDDPKFPLISYRVGLVRDMNRSIAEADKFIQAMEKEPA